MIQSAEVNRGVSLSRLGFGAATVGNLYTPVSDSEADDAVAVALASGIRYFDTAPHYGLGLSERRLGHALSGVERQSFSVSTKVGRLLRPNPRPSGTDKANGFAVPDDLHRVSDYSRDGVRQSIFESLERLQLDHVDIALVHDPDDSLGQALSETIPALLELRDEGVVRAVGAGMNQWQGLKLIVEETDTDVVMMAGRWTLLDRSALPLLDACESRSVSVLAAAPFNSGILATSNVADTATFNYSQADPARIEAARRLAAICRRYDVDLAAAALQFPSRHPAVASVVCGMRSVTEVKADALLSTVPIPDECWDELEGERCTN
jgi:D-threo-aldose 1-dehydrogenase